MNSTPQVRFSPDPEPGASLSALAPTVRTIAVCAAAIICAMLIANAISSAHQTTVKIVLDRPAIEAQEVAE